MKASNTLAVNAANVSLRREVWINTEGKYMRESNTLAANAANISPRRQIWIHTEGQYTLITSLYKKGQELL